MTTHHQPTIHQQQASNAISVVNSVIDDSKQTENKHASGETLSRHNYSLDTEGDMRIDGNYFEEKFNKIKLQVSIALENANVLWSIGTTSYPHIGYLPYLLIMNMLNKSNQKFIIISDVRGYFGNFNSELSEHGSKMKLYCEILSHFNIGTIIKSDDIYYTKEYQKSFFQLTRSVKIIEAIESVRTTVQTPIEIEMVRASDLMSILLMLNDIIYFDISHVLVGEDEAPIYKFISCLLSEKYGKTLNIFEIPTFPDHHGSDMHSSLIETNKISLDATRDQIHEQFSNLKPIRKAMIRNYLKAVDDALYNEEISLQNKLLLEMDLADIIDNMRRKVLLPPSLDCNSPLYVAASFLTDQFHVLKKHWKKNVNKEDRCTGTGKGLGGLEVNQKRFEPPYGGKFIIINWFNKEIVYMLDIDAPAGFFINNNHLYIANNRLNYVSVIDLISRIEIRRIENSAFNCLHSIHCVENQTLLVTSTGIDAIIQTTLNGETLSDWYATEHGYTVTPKGDTRNVARDMDHHHYMYPTLHQTTHINSAIVFDSDHFLATLFHQGLLVKIDRTSGKSEILLSGLHCPHGIKRFKSMIQNDIAWMVCNTRRNEILLLNDNFKIAQKMILEDVNWLQDASQIQNKNIIIADANNSRIIEIDPIFNTVISEFVCSNDWRIYQISDLADFQTDFIPPQHK